MIKNVVFDLGNVLLKFEPEALVSNYIEDPNRAKIVYKNIFKSNEWIELDRGTIREQDAKNIMISRMPEEAENINDITNNWPSILAPIGDNVKLLKILDELNINLYVLSNFHERAYEMMVKKYEFFKIFKGGIVSCYVKQVKPEHEIYKLLLSKYGLLPEETLFIDDMKDNIEAANNLGINTILYETHQDLIKRLQDYGLLNGKDILNTK